MLKADVIAGSLWRGIEKTKNPHTRKVWRL